MPPDVATGLSVPPFIEEVGHPDVLNVYWLDACRLVDPSVEIT